jgi:hypothetical protein
MVCRTLPLYPIFMYKRAIIGSASAYRTVFKINLLFSFSVLHCIFFFLQYSYKQMRSDACHYMGLHIYLLVAGMM